METINYVMRRSQSWIEKHRPQDLDDVKYQNEVVEMISNTIATSALCPNMLFFGAHGSGKTTTALAIARKLFSDELYKSRVLVLSCDPNPIDIADEIESFTTCGQHQLSDCCQVSKIFIIDDAFCLKVEDQKLLVSLMNSNPMHSFIIVGDDDIDSFIQSVVSRCHIFYFKPLPEKFVQCCILKICDEEGLDVEKEALSEILYHAQRDLRLAIEYLQRAARSFRKRISLKDAISATGPMHVSREDAEDFLCKCKSGEYTEAKRLIDFISEEIFEISMYLSEVFDATVEANNIPDKQKSQICNYLIEADKGLDNGGNDYFQLLCLIVNVMQVLNRDHYYDVEYFRTAFIGNRPPSRFQTMGVAQHTILE